MITENKTPSRAVQAKTVTQARHDAAGSTQSVSGAYRTVGSTMLVWSVAVAAWGLFQFPADSGLAGLPDGSKIPDAQSAQTDEGRLTELKLSGVPMTAMLDLIEQIPALNPDVLLEMVRGADEPMTVRSLLSWLSQLSRVSGPYVHAELQPFMSLGGGGGGGGSVSEVLPVLMLKFKLQALLRLILLNPFVDGLDVDILRVRLSALLALPTQNLVAMNLTSLNSALNNVLLGSAAMSVVGVELAEIDPVALPNSAEIASTPALPAQSLAAPPSGPAGVLQLPTPPAAGSVAAEGEVSRYPAEPTTTVVSIPPSTVVQPAQAILSEEAVPTSTGQEPLEQRDEPDGAGVDMEPESADASAAPEPSSSVVRESEDAEAPDAAEDEEHRVASEGNADTSHDGESASEGASP